MSSSSRLPVLLLALLLAPAARAENPVVRIATSLGSFDLELCQEVSTLCTQAAPNTVANFLRYVDDGDFVDSLIHRSVKFPAPFVIQGGSFRREAGIIREVPRDAPIANEFAGKSNERGTVAVPLQGDGSTPCDTLEHSGTSGWFVSVVDNSGLDCGLFTVFAVVRGNGMQVVDAIIALQPFNLAANPTFFPQLYPLFEPDNLFMAFTTVPLEADFPGGVAALVENFIYTEITRVPEPGATAAALAALLALAGLRRRAAWLGFALVLASLPAAADNPMVRVTTPLGAFEVELCESVSTRCTAAAPAHVANFLDYVDDGDYAGSFIDNSQPTFFEGGRARLGTELEEVPEEAAIGCGFTQSNLRGTLAHGHEVGDCESGTSGWFVNLADNSDPLDTVDGGYAVFGVVLGDGMAVADAIAALRVLRVGLLGVSVDLPVLDEYQPPGSVFPYLVRTEIMRAPEPGGPLAGVVALAALAVRARQRSAGRRAAGHAQAQPVAARLDWGSRRR